MGDDDWRWEQPDYYKWAKAAVALGMSLKELNEMPEPQRSIYFGWGMTVHNADAELSKPTEQ
jgi:hypothetical protein